MDFPKQELREVEVTATKAVEGQIWQLTELQLALIGGGMGETVL